jgi:preprotein translocase subunit SecE
MAKKDVDSLKDDKKAKKASSDKKSKNKKGGFIAGIKKWFHDLRSEFKKVTWPSKKTVANHTSVVLATIVIFSLFIGLLDEGLLKLMELLIGLGQ